MKTLFASFLAVLLAGGFPSINATPTASDIDLTGKVAVIETNYGTITFEFFPEAAPTLTQNFAQLASKGYYDGLTFHRIISGFMIQGGDPKGNGTGGTSYKGVGLGDEPGALKLKHNRGAVSWAKSSAPNSIGSQFFIVHQNSNFLDGNYSVFGNVLSGMDVVDKIATVKIGENDKPVEPVVMKKVYLK
jgi:peptidyl-prolyl cis-trans isomerase B (cyclophilin B)